MVPRSLSRLLFDTHRYTFRRVGNACLLKDFLVPWAAPRWIELNLVADHDIALLLSFFFIKDAWSPHHS